MTTPSVDLNIVMPYGVTVEGDGDVKPRIVTRIPKASENDNLALPNGPCRVAASWEGPETVHLYVYAPGRGTFKKGTIPAGGVRSIMVTIGATAGEWVFLQGATALPVGTRGTLEVYPIVAIE